MVGIRLRYSVALKIREKARIDEAKGGFVC